MKRASQVPIVAALAVSVLGAGATRSLVLKQRRDADVDHGVNNAATADLSKVNSFALGLLLGGLRGPLVMALWTSSENQKTERDLEDFDTKVELIRLLQPEFDTVHLFQIWNKAYNISVQMANVPNKYTTILDALQYAFNVDKERPDDINILSSIGGLYFDKFGGAAEKQYFSSRLQAETLATQDRVRVTFDVADSERVTREARLAGASLFQLGTFEADDSGSRLYLSLPKNIADALHARLQLASVQYETVPVKNDTRRDSSGRPTQHDVLLDAAGNVLPAFTVARAGSPQTADASSGAAMPYIAQFAPYPYGVPPYALAFNYYKRSEWLQVNRGARHAQLSDRVIASRSAMSLEKWCEEDWYGSMRAELDLLGRDIPPDDDSLFVISPDINLGAVLPKGPLLDQTIWRFEHASTMAKRASEEYESHIKGYPDDEITYRSHIRDLTARANMTHGDSLYLQTMQATGDKRLQLASEAQGAYLEASRLYTRHVLRYYAEDDELKRILPPAFQALSRPELDDENGKLPDSELAPALNRLMGIHNEGNWQLNNSQDLKEISNYIKRCYVRLRNLSLVH